MPSHIPRPSGPAPRRASRDVTPHQQGALRQVWTRTVFNKATSHDLKMEACARLVDVGPHSLVVAQHPLTCAGMQHPLTCAGMQHPLTCAGMQHPLTCAGMQHPLTCAGMQHPLTCVGCRTQRSSRSVNPAEDAQLSRFIKTEFSRQFCAANSVDISAGLLGFIGPSLLSPRCDVSTTPSPFRYRWRPIRPPNLLKISE